MIRVTTPSRLHFGLLNVAADEGPWPDHQGRPALPSRRFGGVGLMVESPGVRLTARAAAEWSADGPLAGRALAFARRIGGQLRAEEGVDFPAQHLHVEQAAPEHVGLGTGTQLGLAVGRALAEAWGLHVDAPALARLAGRGLRSALGVHGFERGGFLVEAGKRESGALPPLVARVPFPEAWRIVLILPRQLRGAWGGTEVEAFARLAGPPDLGRTDALCRLALLGMLPALLEQDWQAFGEALFDYNARAGEAFAPVQGGIYSHALVADVVTFIRGQGIAGAGQSSWGPAVFAVLPDQERALALASRLREHLRQSDWDVSVTLARSRGSEVTGCDG
jgi:beta-RFAP synthase